MSYSLKIKSNGVTLTHVAEDLNFSESNSSFETSFKVGRSKYPIRIVEDAATLEALGSFNVLNRNKSRYFDCFVEIGESAYKAKIEQIDKIGGFRKCNLILEPDIFNIATKKIADFMPKVNVLGQNPDLNPYTETVEEAQNTYNAYNTLATTNVSGIYPQKKYTFPRTKYIVPLDDSRRTGELKGFLDVINNRGVDNNLIENTNDIDGTTITVNNTNVIAPRVFILSPIYYALQSIGYTLSGGFPGNSFIKMLLLDSENDQMSEREIGISGTSFDMTAPAWQFGNLYDPPFSPLWSTYYKQTDLTPPSVGDFTLKFKFEIENQSQAFNLYGVRAIWQGDIIGEIYDQGDAVHEGEFPFTVEAGQEMDQVSFIYHNLNQELPSSSTAELAADVDAVIFNEIHPTMEWDRFIPDWTFAQYIENFKQLFNLRWTINEVEKRMYIDFNVDFLEDRKFFNIDKSFYQLPVTNIPYEEYRLQYDNEEDEAVLIDNSGATTNGELSPDGALVKTKFKFIPHTGWTSYVDEDVEEKDGVGLMIYYPNRAPLTSLEALGQNLYYPGTRGIYNHYWNEWLKVLLNGAELPVEGVIGKTQLIEIKRLYKVFLNRQLYIIKSMDYKELPSGDFLVKMNLLGVTY